MMKLGTQTASVHNHLMSRMTIEAPVPEVGMGATVLHWTDRYAATVTYVMEYRKRLLVFVKMDKVTVRPGGGGYMGHQDWRCEFDPDGSIHRFLQNKDGGWDEVVMNEKTGRYAKTGGVGLLVGRKDHYRDWEY